MASCYFRHFNEDDEDVSASCRDIYGLFRGNPGPTDLLPSKIAPG